ncbi:type II secretion system F family protein [Candidatus Pacearchaeota archaeon]|nr:type II secretion system F family protein [Candidatus Pacearchaeota archaeon]
MIEELRKNIDTEIEILREIAKYVNILNESKGLHERKMLSESIDSLIESLRMINNSIPEILNNISVAKRLPSSTDATNLSRISYRKTDGTISVVLNAHDKERFLKELSISEHLIKKLKKGQKNKESVQQQGFKSTRGYLKLSNKLFLETAKNLIEKGKFRTLAIEIKRANFDLLLESYVAMIFFTTLMSVFAGIILMFFFLFFNIEIDWPIITLYSGGLLIRLAKVIFIPIILPVATFIFLYIYPSTEKDTIAKKIERELPFATIHMSAISGSGIAPTEIFRIIGISKEYPYMGKEIRKVLNQINLYGYDLVTALTNVSKITPSSKLSELFSGLTTTISSGGGLQGFFEKRAETLLTDYRLERERYTHVAETFMDIYITVVVAAPMILMLLLIMIYMTGFAISFTPQQMTLIMIGIIGLINILFIGLLQSKQPGY